MQISVTGNRGSTYMVQLDGILDRDSVPGIRRKLLKLARKRELKNLEVDFSRVASIDTAGVALLVELKRYLNRKAGQLWLKEANEQVRQMIHLARLDSIFQIKASTDDEI